jgi:hypothetical protein
MGKVIPYRYWNTIRNCGDAITAHILRRVFDLEPVVVPAAQPHLLATGSIFFMAKPASCIWGSGVLNLAAALPSLPPERIRAVRGHDTVALLRRSGVAIGEVPLGDPGMLIRDFIDPADHAPRFRAAVVPHHSALRDARFRAMTARDDVCVVDMLDDSLTPIELIAQSEVVISQSLHGLIFAEALGKPNVWISADDGPNWTFKFHDWFTTVANPQAGPLHVSTPLDAMIAAAELRHFTPDLQALVAAFPRELVQDPPAATLLPFEACRGRPPHLITTPDSLRLDGTGEGLSRLATLLRRHCRKAWATCAEPGYVVVASPAAAPAFTEASRQLLARALDLHRMIDSFWFVAGNGEAAPAVPEMQRQPQDLAATSLDAVAVMLRPNCVISPKSPFVIGSLPMAGAEAPTGRAAAASGG